MFCRLGSVDDSRPVAGHRLLERGVHPAGAGVDLADQRVGVGALQLGQLAPVQHLLRQRVALGGELLQHVGAGAVRAGLALLAGAEPELVEQHLAQLLGRADVEAAAGELVDLRLELGQLVGELGAELAQAPASTLMPCRSISASTGISGRSSVS